MIITQGTHKRKRIVLVAPLYPELTHSSGYDAGDTFYCIPLGLYNIKAMVDGSSLSDEYEVIVGGREISYKYGDYALLNWVLSKKPSVVGFGSYVWNEMRNDTLAAGIKAASPHTRIVGGGPRFLHGAEAFLKNNANYDFIVVGEGEETFIEFLGAVSIDEKDFSNIPGLVWRGENNVIANHARPLIEPLDKLPSPYRRGIVDFKMWGVLGTESQRGCPWNCAYCAYAGFSHVQPGPGVRYFGIERIVSEFEMALEQRVKNAYFIDPDFLSDRNRAIRLCKALSGINRDHSIRIYVEIRAESVDEDVAEALWAAGVKFAAVGIQSIYPDVVKISGRNNDPDRFASGIRALLSKKIDVSAGVIVGLPGDDGTSGPKTIEWVEHLGAKVDLFLFYVIPGSKFWKEAENFNIKFADYPPYYVTHNSKIGKSEIARSLAECYRLLASYEHRRWIGM